MGLAVSAALLRVAPTAVLVRRYRVAAKVERDLGLRLREWRARTDERPPAYWQLVDEYDRAGDRAAMTGAELRWRGVATCPYCATVGDGDAGEPVHWSDGCPSLLAVRMGL
jgi:hypothetical protein